MGVDIIIKELLRMSGVSGYSQIAQSTISIISAIMALAFLVNCFFGYKLIRLQIALSGFAIGGILGIVLSTIMFGRNAGLDGLIVLACWQIKYSKSGCSYMQAQYQLLLAF